MEIMGVVERPMMEYSFPTADGTISSIVKPAVEANNLKSNRQSFKLFGPVCNSLVYLMRTQINISLIFLRFVILLGLMVLVVMLLDLGFSHSHCVILLKTGFSLYLLLDRESLYDAWERFKSMLRKCPHHELPVWRQVQTFYNGVTLANRVTIDAAAGGTIMKKLPSEAFNIIDEIATNLYSYGQERVEKRTAGIHSIDAISALSAQMTTLTQKVDNLGAAMWNGAPIGPCGACGQMGHLSQDCKMPSSAKFLKEVLSTKGKWEGGASVNLMPYSIFEKLGMHELAPSIITLQLADRSIKYPRGIAEDVLVKVGQFIIPVDFIVLDMEEDKNMPLILGRPFLATSRALIDVQKGQLTLRVNDEHVVFNVFKPMKYLHMKEHDIFAIDSINTFGTDNVHLVKCEDSKEDRIENSNEDNLQDMKEEHEEVPSFVDTGQEVKSKLQKASEDNWGQPNRMKNRWRNQADKNGGCYKEHTKAWNESHMRKKKFKDGDKRHHKNKGHIKVDWQRVEHYIEGAQPPRLEPPLSLSTN
ncbi:UNVERIFIED_CONTAM: hypothetical protein Sradi_5587800 [Sesamum radiatum]|uniref:CCHC-type domain-containing protein n=1 Tax=Sesamum radiatum TaxID=300843 RepID=A0AAW2KY75_SESRA